MSHCENERMNLKRRSRWVSVSSRYRGAIFALGKRNAGSLTGKNDRLSLIISIAALAISLLSVVFTAFDFLGSRAVVLFMEPKIDEVPIDPAAVFTLRSASSDVSILRVHMHFLAVPKSGTINLQLLGPKPEVTSEPFQQLGTALAVIGGHGEKAGDSCVGTIPLLVEVKYVAKGRVHDSAAFYYLAYDYFAAVKNKPGYVVLRHLEFDRALSPWESVRGQSIIAAPCDWAKTSDDLNRRDWTFVK